MKLRELRKTTLIILCLILIGCFVNPAKAYQEKNKLGVFQNKSLQEILEKPFYLFGNDKEKAIIFYLKDFVDWDHEIVYNQDYYSEIESPFMKNQENIVENSYLDLYQSYEDKLHYQKISNIFIKESETKDFLQSISKDINQDSTEAMFKLEENGELKVLKESRNGVELKVDESFEKIVKDLTENPEISYIPLEVTETVPEISSDNINKYQIKELIGTGKSDFSGSSQTRIYNIKTAAKKFNGLVLKPNEEMSFTTILGEVNEETGYKEELVIKQNTTVPEFGGGICQLSTTMFRAALNSGMKITERHNHSYPVHYYNPPGTDATVYVPKPDLRFKNITDDYILIQTRMDEPNKKFYIDFYSKKDLYNVELIGPEITERTADGKIRTVLTQIVKDKETDEEIFQDVFKSFYDNPDNYPSPSQIILNKPDDWSNSQWEEYYAKFGAAIEALKKNN